MFPPDTLSKRVCSGLHGLRNDDPPPTFPLRAPAVTTSFVLLLFPSFSGLDCSKEQTLIKHSSFFFLSV